MQNRIPEVMDIGLGAQTVNKKIIVDKHKSQSCTSFSRPMLLRKLLEEFPLRLSALLHAEVAVTV